MALFGILQLGNAEAPKGKGRHMYRVRYETRYGNWKTVRGLMTYTEAVKEAKSRVKFQDQWAVVEEKRGLMSYRQVWTTQGKKSRPADRWAPA